MAILFNKKKGSPKSMNKKIAINSFSKILLQIVTLICGLIVPKMILSTFGSSVNGNIQSITQFLNYIVLVESGMGGVVRAALYKPLVEKDNQTLGSIIKTTESFFRKVAYIFIGHMIVIAFVYPLFISREFSLWYDVSLVLIIGISTVAQYYFGITYSIFLDADLKGYVINIIQIITVIINAVLTCVLIKAGAGIHIVKLASAMIFVVRPIIQNIYVKLKYPNIPKNAKSDNNLIKQRWDGLGQHIAYYVHNNTDIVILTLFQNLKIVSVYSVYRMVLKGLENLVSSISAGFSPAVGHAMARGDKKEIESTLGMYESLVFIVSNAVYSVCAFMILPFISIYTKGIKDVSYIDESFAFLICISSVVYAIRNVYQNTIWAAGKYKETNISAYTEAGLNIVISLILVKPLGLSGVMIGTIVSIVYKMLYNVWYLKNNVLFRPVRIFSKRLFINMIALAINLLLYMFIGKYIVCDNYITWAIFGVCVTMIVSVVILLVNILFYKDEVMGILRRFKR